MTRDDVVLLLATQGVNPRNIRSFPDFIAFEFKDKWYSCRWDTSLHFRCDCKPITKECELWSLQSIKF